jgi:hypothetical protein
MCGAAPPTSIRYPWGAWPMRSQLTSGAVAAVLCASLASCTSAGSVPTPSRTVTPSRPSATTPSTREASFPPTSSSLATTDPRSVPAIVVYRKFMAAVVTAEMHPSPLGAKWPPRADFGRWSFDPLQEKVAVYLAGLSAQGAAFRGTAPRLRLRVLKVDLSENPRPTVILSNCPTVAPTWHEYLTATGKNVPFTKPAVKPPYLVRIKMIKVDGRWGASVATPDTSATCGV